MTHADFQKWKPHFVEQRDNNERVINGGARFEYLLDTHGEFVSGVYEIFVLKGEVLNLVPDTVNGVDIQWRDEQAGQIKWAALGEKLKIKLQEIYAKAKTEKTGWTYFYDGAKLLTSLRIIKEGDVIESYILNKKIKNGVSVLELGELLDQKTVIEKPSTEKKISKGSSLLDTHDSKKTKTNSHSKKLKRNVYKIPKKDIYKSVLKLENNCNSEALMQIQTILI